MAQDIVLQRADGTRYSVFHQVDAFTIYYIMNIINKLKGVE